MCKGSLFGFDDGICSNTRTAHRATHKPPFSRQHQALAISRSVDKGRAGGAGPLSAASGAFLCRSHKMFRTDNASAFGTRAAVGILVCVACVAVLSAFLPASPSGSDPVLNYVQQTTLPQTAPAVGSVPVRGQQVHATFQERYGLWSSIECRAPTVGGCEK